MKILEFDYPEGLKYLINHSPNHLWFLMNDDDSYTVVVTDFVQKRLEKIKCITLS